MKKRLFLLFFVLLFALTSAVTVSAKRDVSTEESYALKLKELGLFYGVGDNDFDLERAPTRIEALVMLIRVLGSENEALSGEWSHPFTDVPAWADKYVGYAYVKGLANGMSLTEFGTSNATSAQYLTFMLRALGYSDANGLDFTWDKPYDLARFVGILPSKVDIENFWRADVANISYVALSAKLKGSAETLCDKLISSGVFTREKYEETVEAKTEVKVPLTPVEISEKCAGSVFYVEMYSFSGRLFGSGSGFFISADGYAITNNHVVENARYLCITLPDGTKYDSIKILDTYPEQDLALIKVESDTEFSYLEIGDSTLVKQGQQVYALGSPKGLENTMSQGIISNVSRIIEGTHYIQISVPIDSGSSGGALIDEYGRVIGVTTASITNSSSDLNLVSPIEYVKELDMTATDAIYSYEELYYPIFTSVYDFGTFTGIQLVEYSIDSSGYSYVLVYDGTDVSEVKGIDGSTVYSASDSYKFCIEQYEKALEAKGMKRTKVSNAVTRYENDREAVEIKLSSRSDKLITVTASLKPVYYPETKGLIDLEWYLGIPCVNKEVTGSATVYTHKWNDIYTPDGISEMIAYYISNAASPNYKPFHTEWGKNRYQIIILSGNSQIVTISSDDDNIYLKIEPFNEGSLTKNFETLAGYIKKNATASSSGKHSMSAKVGEDTYLVTFNEKDMTISFAGRVVLPDCEIRAYIRINKQGTGSIETYLKRGSAEINYNSKIFPRTFAKGIYTGYTAYTGNNIMADAELAVNACITILKRCESNVLTGTSVTLEKLGFASLN